MNITDAIAYYFESDETGKEIERLLKGRKDAFVLWASKNYYPTTVDIDVCELWIEFERVNPRFPTKRMKIEVFEKFNSICQKCGDTNSLEVDHIFPHSKGGSTTIDNLTLLCKKCNASKGGRI